MEPVVVWHPQFWSVRGQFLSSAWCCRLGQLAECLLLDLLIVCTRRGCCRHLHSWEAMVFDGMSSPWCRVSSLPCSNNWNEELRDALELCISYGLSHRPKTQQLLKNWFLNTISKCTEKINQTSSEQNSFTTMLNIIVLLFYTKAKNHT